MTRSSPAVGNGGGSDGGGGIKDDGGDGYDDDANGTLMEDGSGSGFGSGQLPPLLGTSYAAGHRGEHGPPGQRARRLLDDRPRAVLAADA